MSCPGTPSRVNPAHIFWMCTGRGLYKPCGLYEFAGEGHKPAVEWTVNGGWKCANYQPEETRDDKA